MGDTCILAKAPVNRVTCLPNDTGRLCTDGPQCVGYCLTNALLGNGICTVDCASAADCPAGHSCYPVQGTAVCIPPDPSGCADPVDCRVAGYQACVGTAAPGECINPCRSQADCPAGYTCAPVSNLLPSMPQTYCIPPSEGKGLLGTPCGGNGDLCRSGLCLGQACTEKCGVTHAAQACPHGFGCAPVDNGSGGLTMVCAVAGTGAIGAPCTGENNCASGLCVGTPGYCSKFCNDGICPTGYTCQDLDPPVVADGVTLKVCGH
jgi:hypothetical protein